MAQKESQILRVLRAVRKFGGYHGVTLAEVASASGIPPRNCATCLSLLIRNGRVEVYGTVKYPAMDDGKYKHNREPARGYRVGRPSNLYRIKKGPINGK